MLIELCAAHAPNSLPLPWPAPPKEDDTTLQQLGEILSSVYSEFYKKVDRGGTSPRVRDIIEEVSSQFRSYSPWLVTMSIFSNRWSHMIIIFRLFKGLTFAYTRVIPQGQSVETHYQGLKAKYYGASVTSAMNEAVTHLIAGEAGTDKIKEALARYPGLYIVRLEWIDACIEHVRISFNFFF